MVSVQTWDLNILEKSKITEDFFNKHFHDFTANTNIRDCYRAMARNKNLTIEHINSSIDSFLTYARAELCANRSVPVAFFEENFDQFLQYELFVLSRNPAINDQFAMEHFQYLTL